VTDESLLDEMRAAVRGDRQRAEQRRARGPEPVDEAPPAEPAKAEQTELPPEKDGFLKRLVRTPFRTKPERARRRDAASSVAPISTDMSAPCVLASQRLSLPGDEASS
jgi:hypothetical protein